MIWFSRLFNKKYQLGLLGPDPEDPRDYQLAEIQPERVELPDEFDLRDKMPPIERQVFGTCVSNAACAVKAFWDTKEYHAIKDFSERFNHHNVKKISQLWNIQGDYLRNGLKALCKWGVVEEKDWPESRKMSWEEYIKTEPPAELYRKAEQYKGKTYWSVPSNLEAMRQAIFQNKCPLATGMAWDKSYFKPDKDGRLPLPSGKIVAGHAIVCVGWENGKLWFRNSWGCWGKDGYFYIPFEEFSHHKFWNSWVLLDIEMPKPEEQEGWVVDSWLKSEFTKGEIAWPVCPLNFRTAPWGRVIKTLKPGEKLVIMGESKKGPKGFVWQKVKLLKGHDQRTN